MYAVGCEIGDDGTRWASASRGSAAGTASDHGSLRSVVGVDHDGQLHAIDARPDPNAFTNHTTGFVNALGGSEPIIVAGTPYGAEALVAALLATVIQQSAPSPGSTPDAFAIVHDDDLDPFRVSLLVEAARLAGVPADRTVLVPRTDAIAGADDGDPASGAAAIALATLPDDDQPAGGAALAAGAAGLAAGGVIGVAATLGSDSTATAVAPTIGPAGTPLTGPTGTTLTGPTGTTLTGPAGTPITGPAGTPITGPAGTPITGPAGTPITGPAGTTLTGPAGTPITTGPQFPIPKPRPRWLPAAIASGTAVIVAVVTVTLVTNNNDTPTTDPTAAPASTVSIEPSVAPDTAPTTESSAPETTSTTLAIATYRVDTSIGEFTLQGVVCSLDQPFTVSVAAPDVAGNLTFTPTGGSGGTYAGGASIGSGSFEWSGGYALVDRDGDSPSVKADDGTTVLNPAGPVPGFWGGGLGFPLVPDASACP
jgi:hypothetical protein